MTAKMKRRQLITLLGGAAAWPLAARAQQPAVPVIGFLNGQSAEAWANLTDAFRKGLSESGYTEGRNLRIEFRFAQNRSDRLPGLAADLIKRPVQVIVASGGDVAARAAKAATSTIPIVATFGGDPVESGLVASLNRPGGNVTGVSLFNVELVGKQMEVLHRALPGVTRVAILLNDKNPNSKRMLRAAETAAPALAVELLTLTAESDSEMDNAFGAVSQRAAGALIIVGDPLFNARRGQLVALAARHRIPTMYFGREFPEVGGLMSYASSRMEDYRQLGIYAAKILNGTKPADLPVMQPSKLELVINLKTAKALGLDLPDRSLALADEVIE
jgi:putative tryptophan/tyrosine transport system substrate-binding protein